MTLSVLTERRVYHPPGHNGGEDGACGLNILVRADGRQINLGAKAAVPVYAGVSNFKFISLTKTVNISYRFD